ncbi:hypothetical protein Asulf_02265 [Archaeoglobus sulfaticallidus PM70-1]|uniref:Uncharacterized protein n=1 Tax=Archaeoglobus sulfaticallidus PM70-1 TaxID=387631 RepID=N0BGS9_9EURY|nr:hypothetical protein [Archaeoglobus sulfaticallidus]AGK62218.1 hypothetical protein Asulf_02265 [Archaeoglobus sulfaticallidus PM70-1]
MSFKTILKYYNPSTGTKASSTVEITQNQLRIKSKNSEEIIFIDFISSMTLKKNPKRNYLVAGILLILIGLLIVVFAKQIISALKINDGLITSFVIFNGGALVIVGIILLILWWLVRSFILIINQLSNTVLLSNRTEKPLRTIYEKIIEIRAGKNRTSPKDPGNHIGELEE